MYNLIGYSETSSGVKEFIADTEEAVNKLPSCEMGSTVFVIETQRVYMKNSNGEWKEI